MLRLRRRSFLFWTNALLSVTLLPWIIASVFGAFDIVRSIPDLVFYIFLFTALFAFVFLMPRMLIGIVNIFINDKLPEATSLSVINIMYILANVYLLYVVFYKPINESKRFLSNYSFLVQDNYSKERQDAGRKVIDKMESEYRDQHFKIFYFSSSVDSDTVRHVLNGYDFYQIYTYVPITTHHKKAGIAKWRVGKNLELTVGYNRPLSSVDTASTDFKDFVSYIGNMRKFYYALPDSLRSEIFPDNTIEGHFYFPKSRN